MLQPGQIIQNDCYYLDDQGNCQRKYQLVLAAYQDDLLTAVFTTKPNGLTDTPACSLGPPRAGYYVGRQARPLHQESWVEFSSVEPTDEYEVTSSQRTGVSTTLPLVLDASILRAILDCLLQSDDLLRLHAQWIRATIAGLSN